MKYELTQNYDMPELASFYDKYFPIGHKQYTFVEIGANDGVVASKTIDLARRFEWSGIYVEPIPFFAEKCRNLHAANEKIIVKELAISNEDGELELYNLGSGLNTSSEDALNVIKNSDWARGAVPYINDTNKVIAKAQTLTNFMQEAEIEDFDLLIVDVEGFEKQVFEGTDFNKVRPTMIIAELHEHSVYWHNFAKNHQQNIDDIKHILHEGGYEQIFSNEWDSIFIRKEKLFSK
jgi:FkbM family methyltransferase